MFKFININISIFLLSIICISCQSKIDKMNAIVKEYEMSNKTLNDPNIKSMKAEVINENRINIYMQFKLDFSDEVEKQVIKQVFPFSVKKILSSQNITELMNEGVSFNVSLYNVYNDLIVSDVFDKNKLDLTKEKNQDVNFNQSENKSSELNQILVSINSALPIIDKESGIEIYKINLSHLNELTYWAMVDSNLEEN